MGKETEAPEWQVAFSRVLSLQDCRGFDTQAGLILKSLFPSCKASSQATCQGSWPPSGSSQPEAGEDLRDLGSSGPGYARLPLQTLISQLKNESLRCHSLKKKKKTAGGLRWLSM